MAGLVNITAINTVELKAKLLSGGDASLHGKAIYSGYSDDSRKLSLTLHHPERDLSNDLCAYLNGENFCVIKPGKAATDLCLSSSEDCAFDVIDVSDIFEIRYGEEVLLIGVFNESDTCSG